jgi:hypothetical protein
MVRVIEENVCRGQKFVLSRVTTKARSMLFP